MLLKFSDGRTKPPLDGRDHRGADDRGTRRGQQNQAKIAEQKRALTGGQRVFDSLGEKRPQEAVRHPGEQHQHVEQRERHRDPARAHARYTGRVSQCPDQVDPESEHTDRGQLDIHEMRLSIVLEVEERPQIISIR